MRWRYEEEDSYMSPDSLTRRTFLAGTTLVGLTAALFPPEQQARAAALEIVLIGVLLAAILVFRPRGILGEHATVSRFVARRRARA